MPTTHTIEDLKHFHREATHFFASELMLLKQVIPKITDDRTAKTATLLMSCGNTGAAILQLSNQTDSFTSESIMLARSFIEKVINFCYANICDEEEYRAFILHPIYKQYHNVEIPTREESIDSIIENYEIRKEKQEKLKKLPIVIEALAIFSETKRYLPWTKKTLPQRINVIEKWGKVMDCFFTLSQFQYYADASEALHGSLYGCMFNTGVLDSEFDHTKEGEVEKKLYKDNTCILLDLGMLIHECFTLIKYNSDIEELWNHSYDNRGNALNLLFYVLEKKIGDSKTMQKLKKQTK